MIKKFSLPRKVYQRFKVPLGPQILTGQSSLWISESYDGFDEEKVVSMLKVLNLKVSSLSAYNNRVASINTSWLEACFRFYRLFMKKKFDDYLLWPFKKKVIYYLVTLVISCNFTVP
jgi:hypothetical protein